MEDEMVGWHHWVNGYEFMHALGVSDGQGGLVCCCPWGHKELDMTDWTETPEIYFPLYYRLEVQDQGANILRFWWEPSSGMQIVNSPLYPLTAQSRKGSTSLRVLIRSLISFTGLPRWSSDKESTYQCRRCGFHPWVGKIPWRRKWQPTPVFLPGKIPRTEETGGLQSIGSQRVGQDWATEH